MKHVLGLLLVLGLTGCGTHIADDITGPRARALQALVDALPAHYNGGKALVVLNPLGKGQDEVAALETATLAALDNALKGKVALLTDKPDLKPGAAADPSRCAIPPGSTAPISFLMEPDAFTRLAAEHPNATLIISLVGYPAGGLVHAHPPALLLFPDVRAFGNKAAMEAGFKDGHLLALVQPGGAEGPQVYTSANAGQLTWPK